jgi:cysteine synthase A
VLADKSQPVVLFALEWCEFCWSARRLFSQIGIDYRSIDIDSAAMQDKDWGARVRAAVSAKSAMITIPQIFVGGEHIGGCTELFDAFNNGALAAKLNTAGAAFDESAKFDAYGLLPKWLHKR